MERKKRVVPREVCAVRLERGNHCKQLLNAQKWSLAERYSVSLKYDRERRNESLWQKTLKQWLFAERDSSEHEGTKRVIQSDMERRERLLEAILYKRQL